MPVILAHQQIMAFAIVVVCQEEAVANLLLEQLPTLSSFCGFELLHNQKPQKHFGNILLALACGEKVKPSSVPEGVEAVGYSTVADPQATKAAV